MSAYRSSLLRSLKKECQKNYHRDNWLCDGQAFIATSLFDPSMSALPIIDLQTGQSVGLFILIRERELGLDRCETG